MIYKAHLSRLDTTIVVRTFENTIGNIYWTRLAAGQYEATLPENYGVGRIYLPNNVLDIDLEGQLQCIISISAANKILIASQNGVGDFVELLNVFVEFEVFPESAVENFGA
jgi:hypothetical protein